MSLLTQPDPTQQTAQQPAQQPEQQKKQGKFNAQDAFDKFVINGLQILHDEKISASIIKRVKTAKNKVDAVGEAAIDIIGKLESSAQGQFEIRANTVINGANVIVGEIINIAEAAGMPKLAKEQRYQAYAWAAANYIDRAIKSGRVSKDQLKQVATKLAQSEKGQQIGQLVKADMEKQGARMQGQPPQGQPQEQPQAQGGM